MSTRIWMPNGKLSNGTLLLGPFHKRPNAEKITTVSVDGETLYVEYSGEKPIPEELVPELTEWARKRLRSPRQSAGGGKIRGKK